MYRTSAKEPRAKGKLVTVRTYLESISAEADRAHLSSEGISAHVIEGATSFNPALGGAAGGVRLQINEHDFDRAEAILGAISPEEAEGDDEEAGAVRCPCCELAYCSYERPRIRNSAGIGIAALALPVLMLFGKQRWRCHRCGHAWDDSKEGPAAVTRLKSGDPRPIFRLKRSNGGMGMFVGAGLGTFSVLLMPGVYGLLGFFVILLVSTFVGRGVRYEVCSVPECRALLPPGVEECPKCKGSVAGVVRTAEEHYVAAADFRRELAGIRTAALDAKKRRKKAARLPP